MGRSILNGQLQAESWTTSYALWFIIQIWYLILQKAAHPDFQAWTLLLQPLTQLFAYQQAEKSDLLSPGYNFLSLSFVLLQCFDSVSKCHLIKSGFLVLFKNKSFLLAYKQVIMVFLFFLCDLMF